MQYVSPASRRLRSFRNVLTRALPPLVFTEEQASELSDLEVTITDYVDQMNARFITGDADIENEWDTYVKTLDEMNLERYIQIHQEAYDLKYGDNK